MRRLISLCAVLLLVLTAQQMAMARGQTTDVTGQVILCTGNGIVTVTLDAQGKPAGPAHICPDCALSFVLAVANPDLPVHTDLARRLTFPFAQVSLPADPVVPGPAARDPPVAV